MRGTGEDDAAEALDTVKRRRSTMLRGQRAICSVTTGAPAATFGPGGCSGDSGLLLWPIHYSLHYMGYGVLPPVLAHGVQDARGGYAYQADAALAAELAAQRDTLGRRLANWQTDTPQRFPGWDEWDERGKLKPRVTAYDRFVRGGARLSREKFRDIASG